MSPAAGEETIWKISKAFLFFETDSLDFMKNDWRERVGIEPTIPAFDREHWIWSQSYQSASIGINEYQRFRRFIHTKWIAISKRFAADGYKMVTVGRRPWETWGLPFFWVCPVLPPITQGGYIPMGQSGGFYLMRYPLGYRSSYPEALTLNVCPLSGNSALYNFYVILTLWTGLSNTTGTVKAKNQ